LDTGNKRTTRVIESNGANTRLTGSWLIIARTVWLVLVVPSVGFCVASIVMSYQQLQTICANPVTCNNGAETLTPQVLQTLLSIGLTAHEFAVLGTIFNVITAAIWYGVGFLIFWRKSDDWLALLAAFFLVMFNVTGFSNNNVPYTLASVYPALSLPLSLMNFLGGISLGVFFLLFPSGRLVPRWMGVILLLIIIQAFFDDFPSPSSPFDANWPWPGWLKLLVFLVIYGSIIYSQIYRFRRVSTPVQRQQTKWIILGLAVAIGIIIGILAINFLIPSNFILNSLSGIIVTIIIWPAALLLIPISIGFSILRYRLYDIDLLINRTLVYGTLTVLLALVYFGLIFGLQYLLRGIISQNNSVAIVVSTLAIAALFQPLRHRIQAIIDRRFYRQKYDAAKIVEAFSVTLRNEVDLNQLSEHLITVVQDTVQPAHVSLWLRKSGRERKSDTQVE
jgi:hypothetical protein